MASLVSGFEYDIFISYRQKDNKGARWVSEFVDSLKTELESTFKEEISVYFDINPHDGLLETHDVDASLKEKLKCLVFIPIISRTYCDPKSFAWEHEFKEFVRQVSQDQFGLKVKLPNGNVASRVLPVRIHDLDNEDIKECESVLGGVLRGVEFIYKESGFNRPLKPDDDEKVNLNKTKYRNQITKVALAIKEISLGMKAEPISVLKEKMQEKESLEEIRKGEKIEIHEKPAKLPKHKLLSGVIILAIIIIAAILAYPKIFKRDTLEDLRQKGKISVAVMPFKNMTNDTIWNIWQDGIQNELITYLTNSKQLNVRQIESLFSLIQGKGLTNYASITPTVARNIAHKLDANVFIYGTIKQAGSRIRLNTQLIDSKTEEIIKTFEIDGPAKEEMIFQFVDSLRRMVKNFLIITDIGMELSLDYHGEISTNSPEAYRYFIYGQKAFLNRDNSTAIKMYSQALSIDSNHVWAAIMLPFTYRNQGLYDQAKKWCLKVYKKKDLMTMQQKIFTNYLYAIFFETIYEAIKYDMQLLELDDQWPINYYGLCVNYNRLYQYDKAIIEGEKALDIYEKWDSKPESVWPYTGLGLAYHKTGQYKKEKKLYEKAERDFPDNTDLIYRQAVLSLTKENIKDAREYIEKYISILKENSVNEVSIAIGQAGIYSEADLLDTAEDYYRQALSLEPKSQGRINTLAYFLIDKDRNVSEGLGLIEEAVESNPDNYNYLHTKGWGLYKQGKYQEAFDILQKSWDIRREKSIYDHEAYLHLEAAKKTVASQKRTDR